jgi:MFS family permease
VTTIPAAHAAPKPPTGEPVTSASAAEEGKDPRVNGAPTAGDQAGPRIFASLAYPQFRLFWASNLIVAVGLMVEAVAQQWLIVKLTDSATVLGLVWAVWGVAFAASSVPLGILSDRVNRRNLLLAGSLSALVVAALLAVLVAASFVAIWHVVVASGIAGILLALRIPSGQAMTARLVPPERTVNAISLNQMAHSLPSIGGPAVGGIIVALVGIAGAYFVTSAAFLVAVFMMMGVAASYGVVQKRAPQSAGADLREAWQYLRSHRELLHLTAVMLTPFVLGQSYVLLLPLFVEKELGLGPEALGALSAALGAGGVLGSLLVATFVRERQLGLLMAGGIFVTGLAGVLYGLSGNLLLTGTFLFAAGAGESAIFASYNTILLLRLPDELRGRILGLMFTLVGMYPVGAIVAGIAADTVGLRTVAVAQGLVIMPIALGAWFAVLRGLTSGASDQEPRVRVSPTQFEDISPALPD